MIVLLAGDLALLTAGSTCRLDRRGERRRGGAAQDGEAMRATNSATVTVRARDLTAGMLGRTVGVCRPHGRRTPFVPWLMRGELVELVHCLGRAADGHRSHGIVLTLAVGRYDVPVTFAVQPDDLIMLHH